VLTADPTRAARELGWTPRHSSVETIIDTAWRWRQRRLGGVHPPSLSPAAS
jgi:UDP-glucose 4-epimerase